MKRYTTLLIFIVTCTISFGQGSLVVTFTAVNIQNYQPFDSVLVRNLSRGCDTLCYYPDTVLTLGSLGVTSKGRSSSGFRVYQNVPNPVTSDAVIRVMIPGRDKVRVSVSDPGGRVLLRQSWQLDEGMHIFRFTPGWEKSCVLTMAWKGEKQSIRILSVNSSGTSLSLRYEGPAASGSKTKSGSSAMGFSFTTGDRLLLVCCKDTIQSGMADSPSASRLYTFQFAYNIPCPGTPSVIYEGQEYPTVQIFSQCWLAKNLNVGTMIAVPDTAKDNGIIEKYCYDNVEDSCSVYGGFYQWDEMMAYSSAPGSRGICPPGWHLATDEDWKILCGAADSLYRVGNPVWDSAGVWGVNAGYNLKSPWYWENEGNGSDIYGFTVPPIGYRDYWGYVYGFGHAAKYWSTGEYDSVDAWSRGFGCHGRDVSRYHESKYNGYSVR